MVRRDMSKFMNHIKFVLAVAASAALGGCDKPPDPARQAAEDERAIAQVEAVQKQRPPVVPIDLAAMGAPDFEKNNLFGAGCAFVPEGGGMGAVLLTREKRAYIKLGAKVVSLSSDPGGPKAPLGTWEHYVGDTYSLELTRSAASPSVQEELLRWPGRLMIADADKRVVYSAMGEVQCGS